MKRFVDVCTYLVLVWDSATCRYIPAKRYKYTCLPRSASSSKANFICRPVVNKIF